MSKLKTPLLFASIGCIFSIFIGFLNHVNFITMLLRGMVVGIIIGAFVFGVMVILRKMLPDLFEKKISPESSVHSGVNVNIALDEALEQPVSADPVLETGKENSSDDMPLDDVSNSSLNTVENSTENEAPEKQENAVVIDNKNEPATDNNESVNDQIGDLPDVEIFSAAESEQEHEMSETGETVVANVSGLSMNDVQIPSADTKIMAEAIRTILKSDD